MTVHKPIATSSAQALRDLQGYLNPSKTFSPWIAAEKAKRDADAGNGKRRTRKQKQAVQVKLGHGGTLDPLATGVLVVGVGSGTKKLQGFLDCTKVYETVVVFGAASDTYDTEGKVVKRAPYQHVTKDMVEEALKKFRGEIMQKPPIFSALRVQGKRLYEYAREGKEVPIEIQERPVTVSQLDCVEWLEPGTHKYHWPEKEAEEEEKKVADKLLPQLPEDTQATAGQEAQPDTEDLKRKREGSDGPEAKKIKSEGAEAADQAPTVDADAPKEDRGPCPAPAARLRMTVSSGFYVRSLCHDLGAAVGSLGLMAALERSRQGEFELGRNVLEFEDLEKGEDLLLDALDLGDKLAENVAALGQVVNLLRCEATLLEQVVESLGLLLDVSRVLGKLVEDLDVVLSVSVLDVLRSGQNLLLNGLKSTTAGILGDEAVESGDGASSDVKTTTNGTVSTGLLVEVLDKGLLGTSTLIGDRLLGTLGEELDGRVALDALVLSSGLCVLGFGVNLGDEDVGFVGEGVGELLPDRSKSLAVCKERHSLLTSTPRGGEGNNDILVTTNLGLESLVVQHLDVAGSDGLLLLLLEASLLGDEGRETLEVSAAVVVLGSIALSVEPLEGREALDTESTAQFLVGIGVDLCNVDLVLGKLEGRSKLFIDGSKSLAVATPGGKELDKRGLSRLENNVVKVLGDEVDDGRGGRSASQGERCDQSESHVCDMLLLLFNKQMAAA
ncbi:tRNA pseudouridine synthase B [Aureobasidium pullulans]|uniref:tRNA pseudouridine(55) synthase n=1 Tax=Aureobasidium pullulans TaxID=5580 RepID=A0A4S9BCQ4_AURPU|nr:tRNA pseudouridine synthase B [Aureobasidium pullulans]